MSLRHYFKDSKNSFWLFVLFIWLICTIIDRIWWNFFSITPSWDQADYLNSAVDHARALSFLKGDSVSGFKSLLDLSPKIPPLASIVNGAIMAFSGDSPHEAAWSLSIWNGFLIFNITSWGLYLRGKRFSLFCVFITAISPFIFQLRTDYVLELPLISAITFYLFHLGRWCDPKMGGRWSQLILSTIGSVISLLIKQSSLLVILPAYFFVFVLSFGRDIRFRCQFFFLLFTNLLFIYPWLSHNWIMTLGGTYRAVFESARIEGDPSLLDFRSIFWYFPYLNFQFGSIIFFGGLSGLILIFLSFIKSFSSTSQLKNNINVINFRWKWVIFNLVSSWTFTTFIPNKDIRYIACTIPLITILLALGIDKWFTWIKINFKFKLNSLFLIPPLSLSLLPILYKFNTVYPAQNKYYPVEEIVLEVNSNLTSNKKTTVIVVPSTPEVNQHNVTFFGRMKGGNILGRQLGQSLSHEKYVLQQSNWIVLAEGDQGSVSNNSLALDVAIRESGYFNQVRKFPRKNGGNYSLWKRNDTAPKPKMFHSTFDELAMKMGKGPLGIKMIFDEIAIQHMIDGHFQYQSSIREKALSKIISNPNDIKSLWTLTLLKILANRPNEADIYLEGLEALIPSNPWPSTYRSIVNLAALKPRKASKIADIAHLNHKNKVLKGLGDVGAVLGGNFFRLSSSIESIPLAINDIDQLLEAQNK
tara:strand:- start:114 stop:2210 length:2097 start_codon:yes stop_codon:yes gene_type:complete